MEAVGSLAGGVAHDFNTLLGIIFGYGNMLSDHIPQEGRAHDYLENLMEAGRRSKDLVRGLMDFARPSAEGREPLLLASIADESLRLLRASLPATITIHPNFAAESATLLANPTQIGQVIMNLGINAGDALGDEGGELGVSPEEVEVDVGLAALQGVEPGDYLRLTVSDNGVGMDGESRERIFEPFYTTKGVGQGSGLGLSVAHGIVESHGGFITVESEPGVGSLFQVYLPRFRE